MKRYSAYKDSKVEWIGEIPDHWDMKRIKYIANLIIEKAENTTESVFKLALENIESHTGRWLHGNNSFEGVGNNFKKGDVLFNKLRPYLAKVMVAPSDGIAVGELLILRPNIDVDNCFLFYRLLSKSFISTIDGATYGAKMPRANWDMVGNLKVPTPNSLEQEKIGKYLDHKTHLIDILIEKKQKQIELLQEQRAAIINQAVTKGLNPNVKMKDSGIEWLGEVPEHWTISSTKYVADQRTGHTPSRQHPEYWVDCTIPWFTLADVWQLRDGRKEYVEQTKERISKFGLDNSSAELLPTGTVIVSRTASVGFSGIMAVPMATTQDYINWVCGPKIKPEYLLYVFRCMKQEFMRLIMGSTHKTIYMPDARSFRTPVPPIEEQEKIVEFIRQKIKKIWEIEDRLNKSVENLREYRTTLISEAVTGKIDVRDEAIP